MQDGSLIDCKSFVFNLLKYFCVSHLSLSKLEVLVGSMEGIHLVITFTLTMNNQEIHTHTLVDCGATGIPFIDKDFACHHQIPLVELKEQNLVEVIDG